MNRLLTTVAAICLATTASAADLNRPGSFKDPWPTAIAPANKPILDIWQGAYMGLHAAWADGDVDFDYRKKGHGKASRSPNGGAGGLTFGYNWTTPKSKGGGFLFGVEGDFGFIGTETSDKIVAYKNDDDHIFNAEVGGLYGTARIRAGWLISDMVLLYGTGGLAFAELNNSVLGDDDDGTQDAFDQDFAAGWAYGGGVEFALTSKSSFKVEYLHLDFSDHKGISRDQDHYLFDTDVDLVKLGLNFQF